MDPAVDLALHSRPLKVGIKIDGYYYIKKQTDGQDEITGFCVDLMNTLSESLNFSYELVMPADGKWGDEYDGQWTGLLGLLQRKEIDMAMLLAPSVQRGKVVQWTVPIEYWYNNIAVRTHDVQLDLWTAFFSPFQWSVYAYLFLTFVMCTSLLWYVMRTERLVWMKREQAWSRSDVCLFLYGSVLSRGTKIKGLRGNTQTYIKTPRADEAPMFVVTGVKDGVKAAVRAIMDQANHFTTIRRDRQQRHNNNHPYQMEVKVDLSLVGLVVGSAGITIKTIQEKSGASIHSPNRDAEPIFLVSGTRESCLYAERLIREHIRIRTSGQRGSPQSRRAVLGSLSSSPEPSPGAGGDSSGPFPTGGNGQGRFGGPSNNGFGGGSRNSFGSHNGFGSGGNGLGGGGGGGGGGSGYGGQNGYGGRQNGMGGRGSGAFNSDAGPHGTPTGRRSSSSNGSGSNAQMHNGFGGVFTPDFGSGNTSNTGSATFSNGNGFSSSGLAGSLESAMVNGFGGGMTNGFGNGLSNGFGNGLNNGFSNVSNGFSNGLTNGFAGGMTNGFNNGVTSGFSNGLSNGFSNGMTNGFSNGMSGAFSGGLSQSGSGRRAFSAAPGSGFEGRRSVNGFAAGDDREEDRGGGFHNHFGSNGNDLAGAFMNGTSAQPHPGLAYDPTYDAGFGGLSPFLLPDFTNGGSGGGGGGNEVFPGLDLPGYGPDGLATTTPTTTTNPSFSLETTQASTGLMAGLPPMGSAFLPLGPQPQDLNGEGRSGEEAVDQTLVSMLGACTKQQGDPPASVAEEVTTTTSTPACGSAVVASGAGGAAVVVDGESKEEAKEDDKDASSSSSSS